MPDALALFLNSFVTLFSVLDPFGAAVVWLALTPGMSEGQRKKEAARSMRTAALLLGLFTLFGGLIFALFGISIHSLKIAGGLILIQIAFKMLEGKSLHYRQPNVENGPEPGHEEVTIIPMAIPILAGPAAIAAVMVYADRANDVSGWGAMVAFFRSCDDLDPYYFAKRRPG